MKLLVVIITLLIMYSTNLANRFQSSMIFEPYLYQVEIALDRLSIHRAVLRVVFILAVFLIAIALVHFILAKIFFGAFGFLFSIVVLLFCFGDLHFSVEKSPSQILDQAVHHLFSILFWFLILGPVGAVLYVLNDAIYRHRFSPEISDLSGKIQQVLDWIPVRLLGFCFALIGHFSMVIHYWMAKVLSPIDDNELFLAGCFDHACQAEVAVLKDEQLTSEYLIKLIYRALVLWMVVLALVIIF